MVLSQVTDEKPEAQASGMTPTKCQSSRKVAAWTEMLSLYLGPVNWRVAAEGAFLQGLEASRGLAFWGRVWWGTLGAPA